MCNFNPHPQTLLLPFSSPVSSLPSPWRLLSALPSPPIFSPEPYQLHHVLSHLLVQPGPGVEEEEEEKRRNNKMRRRRKEKRVHHHLPLRIPSAQATRVLRSGSIQRLRHW